MGKFWTKIEQFWNENRVLAWILPLSGLALVFGLYLATVSGSIYRPTGARGGRYEYTPSDAPSRKDYMGHSPCCLCNFRGSRNTYRRPEVPSDH